MTDPTHPARTAAPGDPLGADRLAAVRTAYDTVAVDYQRLLRGLLAAQPLDRALLATFAELVAADGGHPVADLGCGPGRVTAHLQELGLDVTGIDLSPAMVAVARATHPGIRFAQGSIEALDLEDGGLGGIVAWYSVIHTPPALLPGVFAEFRRVLRPGGHLLLAFQVGDETVHHTQAYGHPVSLVGYRLGPDRVAEQLQRAGLHVHVRTVREPEPPEKTPQGYLLAHAGPRPATG